MLLLPLLFLIMLKIVKLYLPRLIIKKLGIFFRTQGFVRMAEH
jgi:hypothetical protein